MFVNMCAYMSTNTHTNTIMMLMNQKLNDPVGKNKAVVMHLILFAKRVQVKG